MLPSLVTQYTIQSNFVKYINADKNAGDNFQIFYNKHQKVCT